MSRHLLRREFICALSSVAAWPFVAHAQQTKMRTIGLVGGGTAKAQAAWTAAFVEKLRDLRWVEGQNLAVEYRWLEGHSDRAPAMVADLVKRNVDVIVTHATVPSLAAKEATSVIPIVFASAGDPVGNGLVRELRSPGGNMTGLSVQSAEIAGKQVQTLSELIPTLRHFTFLHNVGNPIAKLQMEGIEKQAQDPKRKLEWTPAEIRRPEEIAATIESLQGRTGALIVPSTPTFNTMRTVISSTALKIKLPTIYFDKVYVEAGGLLSYGPNWPSMWRRAAEFVDKILRGTKPSDIPVEQPPTFDLVINNKTAKAVGIDPLPRLWRIRATEVIE